MIQLDWLLSPIAQYALVALALAGCLVLFLCMRREIALVRRSATENRDSSAVSVATLTSELVTLRRRTEAAETASFTGRELNLTRRAQAVRMQRRGESSATIAAALRLPRNEIDLLVKVQELVNDPGLLKAHGGSKLAPFS